MESTKTVNIPFSRLLGLDLVAFVWKEGSTFVSRCPETHVSSCGDTLAEVCENHKEAMELFFEGMSEEDIKDCLEGCNMLGAMLMSPDTESTRKNSLVLQ